MAPPVFLAANGRVDACEIDAASWLVLRAQARPRRVTNRKSR